MLTIHNIEEKLTSFGLADRYKIYKIDTTDMEYRFNIRMEEWDKQYWGNHQFEEYCIVLERKPVGKRDGDNLYKFYKTDGLTQPAYTTGKFISKINGMKHILTYIACG